MAVEGLRQPAKAQANKNNLSLIFDPLMCDGTLSNLFSGMGQ